MKAWDNFLSLLELEIGSETVEKWLRPLKILRFDACNLYIEASDSFHAHWFEEHIRQKAKIRLFNHSNKQIKVHLSVAGAAKAAKEKRRDNDAAPPPFRISFDSLDPHCTFDSLVVTKGIELPLRLLREGVVAGDPNLSFNPIYLCGSTGSGKTHLLMATAHSLLKQKKNVLYVRAETFTDHVVAAIRNGQMSVFRQAYRNGDVLIIDDVQHFSRKSATQEELFHTFNTLHLAGKQIILAAACSPSDLQYVEPRLVSRFEWGITLPIALPSAAELCELLRKKASLFNFSLRPAIVDYLLEQFSSSPKAAIRAMEALVLRTHIRDHGTPFSPTTLTVASVKHLLADLLIEEEHQALTPDKILRAVSGYYGVPLEDILGKSRSRDCVVPRQIAIHLCRFQLNLPFMKIGDIFGRDHSTVMSSVKNIQKGLDGDDQAIAGGYRAVLKSLQ